MWREHRIKAASTVYLCESETDAIAAISAGVEKDDSIAVVAISGVNSFKSEWTSMFRGKKVILSFDNDTAGQEASRDLECIFRSAGISVSDVDWKEAA
jgi:DNA primase